MKRNQHSRSALLVLLLAFAGAAPALAQTGIQPYATSSPPLVVFIQTDPWAMVLGASTPRVAVYEDGEAIFVKKVGERPVYHHLKLSESQLGEVRREISRVMAGEKLAFDYDVAPGWTDQPQAVFYLRQGEREVATAVYGLMADGTQLPAATKIEGIEEATPPPATLLALHKWLCALEYPGSEEWQPRYVEVMLWDYSRASGTYRWPEDWPGLASDRAKPRGHDYSIFLDGSELPRLRELYGKMGMRDAIQIEDRKMSIDFRYVFPGEPVWKAAFHAAAQAAASQ